MMIAAWTWVKEHAQLVGGVLIGVVSFLVGALLFVRMTRPSTVLQQELRTLDAGKQAAREAVEKGAEAAVQAIEEQHRDTIAILDQGQKAKAALLRSNPRALARYLTDLANAESPR